MDQLDRIVAEALAIEEEGAKEAGALGYMARALVQATMPHKAVAGHYFVRKNGNFSMTMMANPEVGLPYGSIPRLLMAWVTTEAVKTKQRELQVGDSLSEFMRQLGLVPTGGRWGSITRLKAQTGRLFSATVSCFYAEKKFELEAGFRIADRRQFWWDPKGPKQTSLFKSSVTLSEVFFQEIVRNKVPVDMRALKALSRSPLALDIYCWLTYKSFCLGRTGRSTEIPWEALQLQFGSDYPRDSRGRRHFKEKFLQQLKKVSLVYPEGLAEDGKYGLIVKPGLSHIRSAR